MQDFFSGLGLILIICGGLIFFLYSLFLSFLYPALLIRYAAYPSLAACFQFGKIWRMIAQNIGGYLTMWLGLLVLTIGSSMVLFIVGIVLGIIPCLSQIFLLVFELFYVPYLLFASAHLIGQFAVRV